MNLGWLRGMSLIMFQLGETFPDHLKDKVNSRIPHWVANDDLFVALFAQDLERALNRQSGDVFARLATYKDTLHVPWSKYCTQRLADD